MYIFFHPILDTPTLFLSEEESKHCTRVLRKKMGDKIDLADGKGTHAIAKIINDNPKKTELEIIESLTIPVNRSYHLTIAIAPTKNFDRTEWFIEKAVECGIDEIQFIETKNSERNKVNIERCEKIAISAMKQSQQWTLPKISTIQKFSNFLADTTSLKDTHKFIAWCETKTNTLFNELKALPPTASILVLIGPEGDFTPEEVKSALAQGFTPISLGENILRTETAALLACMSVKTLL